MSPKAVQIATLLLPLVVVVAIEILRKASGDLRRYYRRFFVFGLAHGLLIWFGFVWSHWRPIDDWAILFTVGKTGIFIGVAFAAVYMVTAYVLHRLRGWKLKGDR